MRDNKGVTLVALIITIIVILMISGIVISGGNKEIKKSELENLKTNMLLIKGKTKEYVESANFNLGISIENLDNDKKQERIEKAKESLKGEEITNLEKYQMIINKQENEEHDDEQLVYYYILNQEDLKQMGLSNIASENSKGAYIVKYDIKEVKTEIYNSRGIKIENVNYYSLESIENIEI